MYVLLHTVKQCNCQVNSISEFSFSEHTTVYKHGRARLHFLKHKHLVMHTCHQPPPAIYIGSKRSVCLCIWLYQSCCFLWSAILVLTLTLFLVFMPCLCLVYSVCWSPDLSLCLTLILFPVLDLSVRLSLKIFLTAIVSILTFSHMTVLLWVMLQILWKISSKGIST